MYELCKKKNLNISLQIGCQLPFDLKFCLFYSSLSFDIAWLKDSLDFVVILILRPPSPPPVSISLLSIWSLWPHHIIEPPIVISVILFYLISFVLSLSLIGPLFVDTIDDLLNYHVSRPYDIIVLHCISFTRPLKISSCFCIIFKLFDPPYLIFIGVCLYEQHREKCCGCRERNEWMKSITNVRDVNQQAARLKSNCTAQTRTSGSRRTDWIRLITQ